ncbi:MAG: PH domain-containing protein [Luteolibacter sp.]
MSANEQQNWYYASADSERLGPVSVSELGSLASQGIVGPKTLVWSQAFPDWIPAEKIAHLLSAAQATDSAVSSPPTPAGEETAAPVSESVAPPQDLKPRKGSFVFPRIVVGLISAGLLGAVTAVVLVTVEQPPWPALVVFVAGSLLGVISSLTAYRKERYQIQDSRVICHRGGLMSDQTTELEIRNITHVKLKLPWLRYKFFGVGDVLVQTAGNAKPVVLRVISEPESVYAGLRERMRKNGYDLTQRQLLHEEKPALIGILGECIRLLPGVFMLSIFLLGPLLDSRKGASSPAPEIVLWGLLGILVCVLIAFIVLRFLDFRRRTYRVYNDVVIYDEGFLTRENAFIPYENIADANTKCTFFDRILGLYDVRISCQGSSSDIKFRRLRHGAALSAAIDQLVFHARQKQKPAARSAAGDMALSSPTRPRRAEPETIPIEETIVGEFRMDPARTLVPLLLLLPLVPIWIAAMIQSGIRLMSTQYSVRHGSVRHSYRFLTLHDREFAYDKITGLVIKQNLWDRMFGTITLRFWSVGSGKPLEFAHLRANQINLPALMRQAGIPAASPEPYEAKVSFGVLTWLRARLKFLPLLLLFAAGIVFAAMQIDERICYLLIAHVLVVSIACIRSKLYHSRQRLRFHEHHVEAEQGIIARRSYYARYSNVKRTKVTRYPGGGDGELEIFVAAEEEVGQLVQQQQNKNQQKLLKHCSFTTGFLPGVRDQGLLLDDILCGRVEPAPQAVAAEPLAVLLEAPRSVGNALVKLVLLSIVLFPLIALLPFTIPFTVIRVKRWRYRIEAARIVMSWGIFYRSETSVLLDRVDSLKQSQGPLNKLFRNGSISIMTAGSSKPDLNIIDSTAYLAMYEIIRERSQ